MVTLTLTINQQDHHKQTGEFDRAAMDLVFDTDHPRLTAQICVGPFGNGIQLFCGKGVHIRYGKGMPGNEGDDT